MPVYVCVTVRERYVFFCTLPFLRFTIFQQMRVSLGVPVFAVLHSQSNSLRNGGISAAACARGQDTILKSQTHRCKPVLLLFTNAKFTLQRFQRSLLKWHLGVFTQKAYNCSEMA